MHPMAVRLPVFMGLAIFTTGSFSESAPGVTGGITTAGADIDLAVVAAVGMFRDVGTVADRLIAADPVAGQAITAAPVIMAAPAIMATLLMAVLVITAILLMEAPLMVAEALPMGVEALMVAVALPMGVEALMVAVALPMAAVITKPEDRGKDRAAEQVWFRRFGFKGGVRIAPKGIFGTTDGALPRGRPTRAAITS
jgi:hypothetical protein